MARETGTVKWFSNEKGYGFIERDGDEDVFVHHSDIEGEGFKTLQAGESVEFEVLASDRGPKAQRVTRRGQEAEETTSEAGQASSVAAGRSQPSPRTAAGEDGDDAAGTDGGTPGRTLAEQLREKIGRRFFG